MSSPMAATRGSVGIRDAAGALVDSVAYGNVAGNAFIETSPAPAPPVTAGGSSRIRSSNGVDADDNSADFRTTGSITPKGANR